MTVAARLQVTALLKQLLQVDMSVLILQLTALADGSHTIKIDASDFDGNAATQKTVTFKIDTVPPTLSITAPADKLVTNKTAVTVTGTTNDATSSPVTVTVKLNSGTAETVTVGSDGTLLVRHGHWLLVQIPLQLLRKTLQVRLQPLPEP